MKAGDYVRIKWGNGLQTISKCKNIADMGDTQYAKDDFYIHTDQSGEVIYKTMIVKSSPNIIDLIEVGDILTIRDILGNTSKVEVDERFKLLSGKIVSIVTKEQFENMEYRIEGK